MTDRFKFRCGITISHYDEDGNDIETLLLVNNVTIYDDGEVGFNRESLKEAVKKKKLSGEEERTLWNSLDEYEVFEDWYQMPADFIEQCTGLKDKHGKLIYEHDLIKSPNNNNLLEVVWEKGVWQTKEYRKKGMHELFLYILATGYEIEIVGNIHEKESK